MPFIPFAATVGTALGGSATLGGLAIATAAGSIAQGVTSTQSQANAAKKAANAAAANNAAAISQAQDSVNAAGANASAAMKKRNQAMARSKSIYTSPLGITTQAQTAKKTLLGQ